MKFRLSVFRGHFIVVVFALVVLFESSSVRADTPALCTEIDYKVAAPTVIAVQCDEDDVSGFVGAGKIYDWASGPGTPLALDIAVTPYPKARKWLILELKPASSSASPVSLQLAKKYKVVFSLHPPAESVAADATPTTFDLEMSNTVAVSPAIALSAKNSFEFVSHLAFKTGPNSSSCALQVEDFNGKIQAIKAHDCTVPALINPATVTAATLAREAENPEDLGSFLITLDDGNKDTQQLPVAVQGLTDIFDKPVKIDSKSQLLPEKAPTSKDSSSYYVNLNYAAGRGSKPGWVLDGKISPVIGKLYGGFQFSPLASADVGHNQISTLKYTDTINFGASLVHMYQPNDILQGLLFKPGATYETDREFDRHNLLATLDFRFNFAGLYNPRQRASAIKYSDELKIAEAKKIPWTRANSKPVLLGYALDFHVGFEMGGALKDTNVKASVGKANLPLPSYHIARVVPQVHGLFEIGRFSIDAVGTARYLTTIENTILERQDHTLFLKRLHGWNAYGVISGSWNFDPAGHFAFTIAYKEGFAPPKFSRVNTVQSGITIKY